MASLRKRGKSWYFTYSDADGMRREVKGCSDRRVTEESARQAESRVSKVKDGTLDPKAERMAKEGRRPIQDHIEEFIASIEAACRTPQYVAQTRKYVTRVCELGRISQLGDLTPSAVVRALTVLREQGFATRTLGAYATGIKALSKWAWEDGRTVDYALNALVKPIDENDRRRVRRPLTDGELRALIETARQAPPFRKASGADRAMLYVIASLTGFRRNELLSLVLESFHLDGPRPVVVCKGAYTKNKARAEQPLPLGIVPTIRAWLTTRSLGKPVFESIPRFKTGVMIRKDLARCGVPFETSEGIVDLHSLRHGYITSLGKAGLPIKVTQTLARHSDPRLTLNVYSHISLFDTASAVESLPDLSQPSRGPESMSATGTDGRLAANHGPDAASPLADGAEKSSVERQPISGEFAVFLPCAGVISGHGVSSSDATDGVGALTSANEKPPVSRGLDACSLDLSSAVVRVGDGIRTRDIRIHNLDGDSHKSKDDNGLRIAAPSLAAYLPCDSCKTDPGLAAIIQAWPGLSVEARANIGRLAKRGNSST